MNEKTKERFRELVDSTELTKTECARQIGISYTTFNKIYSYGKLTRIRIAFLVANYFNISLDYLVGHTDDKEIKGHRH